MTDTYAPKAEVVYKLHIENLKEISFIKAELQSVKEDIQEMKTDHKEMKKDQKDLLKFMEQMRGGRAWVIGILTVAATLGSIMTALLTAVFHKV